MHCLISPAHWRRVCVAVLTGGCVIAGLAVAASAGESLDPLDPLAQPAAMSRRATASVLIAVARPGERIVAAGESGILLFTDNDGQSWQQAQVPVSVSITALAFANAKKGWAVGHSGVILATQDGGQTWTRQLDGRQLAKLQASTPAATPAGSAAAGAAAISGDPFLDVHFLDERNGFAVGAFGLILRTRDGGQSWLPWGSHLPNPDGNHLYGIRAVGTDLYIVGERGSIYMSGDGGETFTGLKSPYEGSFFGLAATPDGGVLVYGLRGHAFKSTDRGQSWAEVKVGAGSAWLGAAVLPDKRIVMVSQAGEVAQSHDGGSSFVVLPNRQPPLTGVIGAKSGAVITVGVRGAGRVELPASKGGV